MSSLMMDCNQEPKEIFPIWWFIFLPGILLQQQKSNQYSNQALGLQHELEPGMETDPDGRQATIMSRLKVKVK